MTGVLLPHLSCLHGVRWDIFYHEDIRTAPFILKVTSRPGRFNRNSHARVCKSQQLIQYHGLCLSLCISQFELRYCKCKTSVYGHASQSILVHGALKNQQDLLRNPYLSTVSRI